MSADEWLHDDDECVVCRDARARATASRWDRLRRAAIPYLIVITAIVIVAMLNGLLGYGPTP